MLFFQDEEERRLSTMHVCAGAAKMCGSGGAAVAYLPDPKHQLAPLQGLCAHHNIMVEPVKVAPASQEL